MHCTPSVHRFNNLVSPYPLAFIQATKKGQSVTKDLSLEQIIIDKPIVIENIYYDVAKWDIKPAAALELDKLVLFLKDNPKINIELSSHTDSRSSNQYNMVLSEKRAKSAVDYLISQGIDAGRLKAKGYGETKLLNRCTDGVQCTEEEQGTAESIIDVRNEGEWSNTGIIKNASRITLAKLEESLNKLDKNQHHFVHCAGGYRSMIAASIMKRNGFNSVTNIRGGVAKIKEAGVELYPV